MDRQRPIGMGDLIRALQQLLPGDAETRHAIAAVLGFGRHQAELPMPVRKPQVIEDTIGRKPDPASASVSAEGSTIDVQEGPPVPAQPMRSDLTELPPRKPVFPDVNSLDEAEDDDEPVMPLDPLFVPSWTRAIIASALAMPGAGGPLDIDWLVEDLARGRAVDHLPTLPRPTLVQGVQVLLDLSEAMLPYRKDQVWLLGEIRKTVGDDKVSVLSFAGSPLRGAGSGPQTEWAAYQPPPRGTPVLAITDLGIGVPPRSAEPATASEWLAFAAVLYRYGCPLIGLTPYPPQRWPTVLVGRFPLIVWDRGTTAGAAGWQVKKGG
jgi:hypothetical protein